MDLKSSEIHTRVIGVYTYSEPGRVLLYEDACVVAGSEQLIKRYIALLSGDVMNMVISKIRFGAIYDGLNSGAVYAFDQVSYRRFYPLARQAGIDDLRSFPQPESGAFNFMKVELDNSRHELL